MKTRSTSFKTLLLTVLLIVATSRMRVVVVATAASVVNDTFADGNSQNQDLANNSIRIFQGRSTTVRTDAVGSVTFDLSEHHQRRGLLGVLYQRRAHR